MTFRFESTLVLLFAGCLLAGCNRALPPDVRADAKVVDQLTAMLATGGDSSAESSAPVADPTGFATFTGTITVNGQPPAMRPVPVSGNDAGYCAPGGQAPLMQTVVVGPNGGLANVLIYVDMPIPLEWEHPDHAASREILLAGTEGFDQKGCMFLSHVFAMRSTQQLEVLNSDEVSHNTNIQGGGRAKSINETIPAGKSSVYEPGGASRNPFSVACNIHPWMQAYMYVSDNPYFAVTDEQGRFEIPNLPAGVELEFKIWQEQVKSNWENVTVNGADPNWSKGKFTLNLQPDTTENWEVVVDASILQ